MAPWTAGCRVQGGFSPEPQLSCPHAQHESATPCSPSPHVAVNQHIQRLAVPLSLPHLQINNAGMSYDHPDYLDVISDDLVRDLITINTLAPTRVPALPP